jgi:hypothetical protein
MGVTCYTKQESSHEPLELTDDEIDVIQVYRRAKKIKYSEITIAIQEGERVKLWLTEKRK